MPVDFARIRELREKKQLTLQEAANRAGWTNANARVRWSDFEKGRYADPQLSTLESICRALDCDLLDIITRPVPAGQKRKRPSGAAGSKG